MFETISVCSLVVLIVAVIVTIYAFYEIFQRNVAGENDVQGVQRQLRGFALLMVANIVMVLGMLLCAGGLVPYFMDMLRR